MTPGRDDICVIVGAAGGVGRALAERLATGPRPGRIIALSRRRPGGWPESARRGWMPVDLLDESSLAAAARSVQSAGTMTQVWVATGLLHDQGLAPEKSMRALDAQSLTQLFQVNAVGPALVAKHLLPCAPKDRPSQFAALSARVGSIGDNGLGGWYGYRAAKAALNMLIRTLAVEQRRTHPLSLVVALHPGTVATALSAPFRSGRPGVMTPDQSASALIDVVADLGPQDTGGFFAWDGKPIPW